MVLENPQHHHSWPHKGIIFETAYSMLHKGNISPRSTNRKLHKGIIKYSKPPIASRIKIL